jgi:hypothetical protein
MRAYEVSGPGIEEELVAKLACQFSSDQQLLVREMEIYGRLRRLDLDPEVRVPELKGKCETLLPLSMETSTVSNQNHSRSLTTGLITSDAGVVGFVLGRIPAKYSTLQPIITSRLVGDTPGPAMRQRWASQIERIVRELHRHDIVWGDAKPDNVLIDHDDHAWVLDFHGGATEGWVERSMLETKEGDLHAVAKMEAALQQAENVRQGGPGGGSRDGMRIETR